MNFEDLYHRGLSLEKLRAFLAVVRAGSVTAAAGGEGSRRSLMSRQIGELEKTLGIELFFRKGKTLKVTAAGRELALLTATCFNEFEAFAERATEGETGLRIGAGASIFEAVVFPRIHEMQTRLKGFRFEFITNNTSGIIRALHEGELDIGIIRAGDHGPNLLSTPCGDIDFVPVGRIDFDRNLPEWGMAKFLNRVPLAMIRGDGQFVSAFHQLCEEMDAHPQIVIKTESFGHIRQLLLSGHPGGVLPKPLTAELPSSDFHVFEDPRLRRLSRELVIVIDTRVARLNDRLGDIANELAQIL
ncbi:MAG: LysR family transcriptional regulator [Opitutales bacterium]|nr:LysR family transcriptional regulator [Opitutales bacterium]